MAIYSTRWFARWANQQGLTNEALCRAVHEMSRGLYEANLGRNLLKKRIARPGGGKSGGFRTLVATNFGSLWIFLFGFAKNEQEDIEPDDLNGYRKWADELAEMSLHQIHEAHGKGALMRVDCDA